MTLVLLIRHGETDWNFARRVQGTTDIPLNDTGRAQALEAGARVREILGERSARTVSSDLSRARETASIIATAEGLPQPWTTPLLRERSYGDGEGMPLEDYYARFADADPPGAERRQDVLQRAQRGIKTAIAEVTAQEGRIPEILVIVAHGGVIRELLTAASNGELPRPGKRIANASVQEFEVIGDTLTIIRSTTGET